MMSARQVANAGTIWFAASDRDKYKKNSDTKCQSTHHNDLSSSNSKILCVVLGGIAQEFM